MKFLFHTAECNNSNASTTWRVKQPQCSNNLESKTTFFCFVNILGGLFCESQYLCVLPVHFHCMNIRVKKPQCSNHSTIKVSFAECDVLSSPEISWTCCGSSAPFRLYDSTNNLANKDVNHPPRPNT